MAGYSGTPLVQKLGIKAGMRVYFVDPPHDYFSVTLGRTPTVVMLTRLKAPLDFVQWFTRSRSDLEQNFALLADALAPDGMLWVSWPKKTAQAGSDVTEGAVREVGLKGGLVDVKVCAVDDTWSGLKFVRRLKDR